MMIKPYVDDLRSFLYIELCYAINFFFSFVLQGRQTSNCPYHVSLYTLKSMANKFK